MSAYSKEESAKSLVGQAEELRTQARAERYFDALAKGGYITLVVRTSPSGPGPVPIYIGVGPVSHPSDVGTLIARKQHVALKKLVHDLLDARKDGYPR